MHAIICAIAIAPAHPIRLQIGLNAFTSSFIPDHPWPYDLIPDGPFVIRLSDHPICILNLYANLIAFIHARASAMVIRRPHGLPKVWRENEPTSCNNTATPPPPYQSTTIGISQTPGLPPRALHHPYHRAPAYYNLPFLYAAGTTRCENSANNFAPTQCETSVFAGARRRQAKRRLNCPLHL